MALKQMTMPLSVCVSVEYDDSQVSQSQAEEAIETGVRQALSETVLANVYTVESVVLKEVPPTVVTL